MVWIVDCEVNESPQLFHCCLAQEVLVKLMRCRLPFNFCLSVLAVSLTLTLCFQQAPSQDLTILSYDCVGSCASSRTLVFLVQVLESHWILTVSCLASDTKLLVDLSKLAFWAAIWLHALPYHLTGHKEGLKSHIVNHILSLQLLNFSIITVDNLGNPVSRKAGLHVFDHAGHSTDMLGSSVLYG